MSDDLIRLIDPEKPISFSGIDFVKLQKQTEEAVAKAFFVPARLLHEDNLSQKANTSTTASTYGTTKVDIDALLNVRAAMASAHICLGMCMPVRPRRKHVTSKVVSPKLLT
jgi:hypothetical protein